MNSAVNVHQCTGRGRGFYQTKHRFDGQFYSNKKINREEFVELGGHVIEDHPDRGLKARYFLSGSLLGSVAILIFDLLGL